MGDYVDRQVAFYAIQDTLIDTECPEFVQRLVDEKFYKIPSADVRPVVHGKWIKERTMNGLHYVKCDKCGYKEYDHIKYTKFNFCPECGADMR